MSRILILTAGYGEGHNTAARCCREALQALDPGGEARVLDPMSEASPRLTAVTREAYLGIINHLPSLWKTIYDLADTNDFGRHGRGLLGGALHHMQKALEEFRPDVVVTTYPLYTTFWEELFPGNSPTPCPFVTVVTDSITVNAIWSRGRSSCWCVTDPLTVTRLADLGVSPDRIHVTGFPVSPKLASLPREKPVPARGEPLRLLWFPIAAKKHTESYLQALSRMPRDPAWTCTVVLGKHKDNLRPMIEKAIADGRLPAGTEIIGWTDQIPELLNRHHVVLGKAGGATVHEARTAARPMLIHYMVPGQEQGNALLLESEGGGHLLAGPDDLIARWEAWTRDGHAGWLRAHQALLVSAPPDPAHRLARLVLSLSSPTPA